MRINHYLCAIKFLTPDYQVSNLFTDRNIKKIEVVAAIILDSKGRIFATQRGYGEWKDYWELPGGKMEAGETPEQALRREIWEELETQITVERLAETVEWDYPQFHLTMHYNVTLTWLPSTVRTRSLRSHAKLE